MKWIKFYFPKALIFTAVWTSAWWIFAFICEAFNFIEAIGLAYILGFQIPTFPLVLFFFFLLYKKVTNIVVIINSCIGKFIFILFIFIFAMVLSYLISPYCYRIVNTIFRSF